MIEQAFSSPTCFSAASVIGPDKLAVSIIFFSAAVFVLLYISNKRLTTKTKLALIYTHLFFLAFPFVLLSTNAACGTFCMACHNNLPSLLLLSLPTAIGISAVAGFIVLPAFYITANKKRITERSLIKFVETYSKKTGIKAPSLHVINRAKPIAFSFRSFRSSVFISIGALDILTRKELEAVMLHELAHLRQRSSAMKFSSAITKFFSPLSLLVHFHDNNEEEHMADAFAAKEQGTAQYLLSAKRKFKRFERFN